MKIICLALALISLASGAAPASDGWTDAPIYPVADDLPEYLSHYPAEAASTQFALKYGPDTVDNSIIHFKLSATTAGWVALGIASAAKMVNMDIVTFQNEGGNIVAYDQWSASAVKPTDDSVNDITLDTVNSSYDTVNNQWELQWSRPLVAQSQEDLQIYCGKQPAALAAQNTDTALGNNPHSLTQFTAIDLDSALYSCQQAPAGYTDWAYKTEEPPVKDDEGSSILNISLVLMSIIMINLV